ncbi:MAG: hypothetical protein QW154_02775 [Sulfolobales archaeon]
MPKTVRTVPYCRQRTSLAFKEGFVANPPSPLARVAERPKLFTD